MYFSAKKCLILIREPFSWTTTLVGKRVNIDIILWGSPVWHPWSWPVHDGRECERQPLPSYFPTNCQPRAASFLSKETECYTDVIEVPPWGALRPFTITECPFRVMLTFSGMSTAWLLRVLFILSVDGHKRARDELSQQPHTTKQEIEIVRSESSCMAYSRIHVLKCLLNCYMSFTCIISSLSIDPYLSA